MFFAQTMCELSLDVFLVRYPGVITPQIYDQIFTLLAALGLLAALPLLAASPFIADALRMTSAAPIFAAMFASIPLVHMQRVALSKREMEFHQIGFIEFAGLAAFFAIAIPLAFAGYGAWSPVCGWWAQQIFLLIGYSTSARYQPRLTWRADLVRSALAYGTLATASVFAANARALIIPLIIGPSLGPSAVAITSLAMRLLEQLSAARQIVSRMSISFLAKVAHDHVRLHRMLTLGMELQLLAAGAPIITFCIVAPWLVPALFGEPWRDVAAIVCLLAPAQLALAAFSLQHYLLMSLPKPTPLLISQLIALALAVPVAVAFVPRFGAAAFAYAELAAMLAWFATAVFTAKHFGQPRYFPALLWLAAAIAACLAPLLSWWLLLALPAIFFVPATWRELHGLRHVLWSRGDA